jgi:predicted ATPase
MKIVRLTAVGVHGYLAINVEFFPDLTFLTGLNGSGKTSALRLLMGLLAPNVVQLMSIVFDSAIVVVDVDGSQLSIEARREADGLVLKVTGVDEPLKLSVAELQLMVDQRTEEGARGPVQRRLIKSKTVAAITRLSTPMFLGLDRRSGGGAVGVDEIEMVRRRDYEIHREFRAERARSSGMPGSLIDVELLVRDTLNETRAAQERMDEKLRTELLIDAFRYERATVDHAKSFPDRRTLEEFKRRQTAAEQSAARLRLPIAEVQTALTRFFGDMTNAVEALEAVRLTQSEAPQTDKPQAELFAWITNKSQADRIMRYVDKLEKYEGERLSLHAPMDRFLHLANTFLDQTNKRLRVGEADRLEVLLADESRPRSTRELSSGESQIVIMLAHLSLSRELRESGVFVVDEPELSLHLAWQERFVQAVQEANPKVQLIMATHSPAIILDRVSNVRSLS